MKKMRLACQSITWGEKQNEDFSKVFREIKAAGFEGVEIGWRRLVDTEAPEMKKILLKFDLKLVGIHMGGNLKDDGQAKGEWEALDLATKYMNEVGAELLMFSGLKYTNDVQLKADVDLLTEASKRCETQGIKFLYHNHDWEFKHDRKVFNALLASSIKFCPDLGWIYKAGESISAILDKMKGRIGAIHFKDFKNKSQEKDEWLNPVVLGTGKVPLKEGAEWVLKNEKKMLWWIAEQDFADIPPSEAAVQNAKFLNSNIKLIGKSRMIAKNKQMEKLKAKEANFRYHEKSNPFTSGLDMMTYGTYEIAPNSKSSNLCHPKNEAIIFCLKGEVKVELESGSETSSYTLSHYDTLYVPLGALYNLENISGETAELSLCQALAENRHAPFYSSWEKFSKDEKRIRHLDGKEVFIMFDVGEKADRLIAGYTIYEPYTRAYPAHNHTDQEEIYIFCKGHGAMEVYKDEKSKTFVTSVDEMDAVTIPVLNYHPVFSQDKELHFIWCIAGERYWVGDKDKDFMKGDKATLTT